MTRVELRRIPAEWGITAPIIAWPPFHHRPISLAKLSPGERIDRSTEGTVMVAERFDLPLAVLHVELNRWVCTEHPVIAVALRTRAGA